MVVVGGGCAPVAALMTSETVAALAVAGVCENARYGDGA